MSYTQHKAGHGCAMHVAASRRCDFARPRVTAVSNQKGSHGVWSQLNTLAPQAPEGWMQRLSPLHECGGAEMPLHSWAWQTMPTERTRDRDAFLICITFVQPIFMAKEGEQSR